MREFEQEMVHQDHQVEPGQPEGDAAVDQLDRAHGDGGLGLGLGLRLGLGLGLGLGSGIG